MSRCHASGGACGTLAAIGVFMLAFRGVAQLESDARGPEWYLRLIQDRAATAQQYTFDAVIDISRKNGDGPREAIAQLKVKLAVAPDHKYLLWLGDGSSPQYLIVSDGQRTWAVTPASARYMEIEAIAADLTPSLDLLFPEGVTSENVNPVLCSNAIVPILASLMREPAAVVDMKTPPDTTADGIERDLPVLTVLSGRSQAGNQKLTEIMFDPETFKVTNLNWTHSTQVNEEPRFAFLSVRFSRFDLGNPVPPSYFFYTPGNGQQVQQLPVPGLDPTPVLDRPAPDFELQKTRLADLRGHPVLIEFTGESCPPCKKQSAAWIALQRENKDRGLLVLEAGREHAMLRRLFHVQFVPTTVLIDTRGVVRRYLPGVRELTELRSAVQGTAE